MDPLYALMMYGVAAIMISFIATIVAGTIAGTVLALLSLADKIRSAYRVSPATARGQSEAAIV